MRQKSNSTPASSETLVRNIRRATRKHYSAEDKIRIVLDGLRGEDSIAELCRKEGIAQSLYYSWSKEFLEAGKRRLAGDTARAATTDEVKICAARPGLEGGRCGAGAGNPPAQKKHDRGWGRRRMRYPASEKLEIIRIVEQSHLSARRTLDRCSASSASTFYRWYDRYRSGGPEALEDQPSKPEPGLEPHPDDIQDQIVA